MTKKLKFPRRHYLCTENCYFASDSAKEFLEHIGGCPQVAVWIGGWAKRMRERSDWKERSGLVRG